MVGRSEVFEDVGESAHVGREVELHVLTQRAATALAPDALRVDVVVLGAGRSTLSAVKNRTRWQLLIIQRRESLDVLLRKHALAEKAIPWRRRMAVADHSLKHGEFGRLVRFLALGQ